MRKICLVVVGLYLQLVSAFSQVKDTAVYKQRKLSITEINFVSSYYHQDGNNSAVTGGIGTEQLTDYSNNFEVKLSRYNKKKRKEDYTFNLGIDYYTSASSDKIDPYTISSASHEDLRVYPSVNRTVTNEAKGNSMLSGISYSHESDYRSYGITAGFSKQSKDKNSELTVRGQVYLDQLKLILPIEMRTLSTGGLPDAPNEYDYPWRHRNTFSTSFNFSHVLNQRLQMMAMVDLTYQQGYLGLPFHRVYFLTNQMSNERLPSSRFKIPVAIRAHYFAGNKIVLRGLYRFYKDDWGLNAHTFDIETAYKITPFFSIVPFYRYYTQSAIDFFAAYKQHYGTEPYYSSNYDYSKFNSQFYGCGFRVAPSKGIFGIRRWHAVEVRYGHYERSNGLHADIVSLHLQYK